jgi:hypothetical protein
VAPEGDAVDEEYLNWIFAKDEPEDDEPMPTITVNTPDYFAQLRAANKMMERMREIAIECGGTFGEGALYDSLTMTSEQARAYTARIAEEFKNHG